VRAFFSPLLSTILVRSGRLIGQEPISTVDNTSHRLESLDARITSCHQHLLFASHNDTKLKDIATECGLIFDRSPGCINHIDTIR